ncbi:hypothetical protein LCGC14_0947430 [marine sediment metagenome]|uniref:Uncharacterized protein n=1 Tax=marine sediment metagenome TaxID=412755 RepID=A0A0F9RPR3_9ZZZZ
MKTAKYNKVGGGILEIEYDEDAPCIVCGEPVVEASMGGTVVCPRCDCGNCRYCGVQLPWHPDKEKATRMIKEHVTWHKEQQKADKDA